MSLICQQFISKRAVLLNSPRPLQLCNPQITSHEVGYASAFGFLSGFGFRISDLSPPFFSHTIKMLMSAGDTPEIREAWPIVIGRIFRNFCRASIRRLGTVE